MDPFIVALGLFPVFTVLFSWSVFLGGLGTEKIHKKATNSGLLGLVALPIWMFCVLDVLMQLVLGVEGQTDVVLCIATLALFVASLGSLRAIKKIKKPKNQNAQVGLS